MGVSGSGKTVTGKLLSSQLNWQFVDADDLHPTANIEKMSRGIPLDDNDRRPWLASLRALILKTVAEQNNLVLACSALKRTYRELLCVSPEVKLVYLKGNYDLLLQRLHNRQGHYMHENMLASQFAALEEPTDALVIDVTPSPEIIVSEIRTKLSLA